MKVATPTHSALLAENRRLKEQLKALQEKRDPISINPVEGKLTITGWETDNFTIDRLEASTQAITDLSAAMTELERWAKPNPSLPDMSQALQTKVQVSDMKLTVPFKTLNKMIPQMAGRQLEESGVRSLSVSAGRRPNEIAIKGRVKKLIEVGFEATGELSASRAGQSRFRLTGSRVAGVPMPNFLTGLATSIFASQQMSEMGVTQRGDDFLIDQQKFLPKNIDAQVTGLSVNETGIVVEGGSGYLSAAT